MRISSSPLSDTGRGPHVAPEEHIHQLRHQSAPWPSRWPNLPPILARSCGEALVCREILHRSSTSQVGPSFSGLGRGSLSGHSPSIRAHTFGAPSCSEGVIRGGLKPRQDPARCHNFGFYGASDGTCGLCRPDNSD